MSGPALPLVLCELLAANLEAAHALADVLDTICPDRDRDGFSPFGGDCDDDDIGIHPGALETCANGVDEDCDGADRTCEGVLLEGAADAPARGAVIELAPAAVLPDFVENGVIMNRLDAFFLLDATVGQVNEALAAVDAGIVTMSPGSVGLTLAVPRAVSVEELAARASELSAQPGIAMATIATEASPDELPPPPAGETPGELQALADARFPAAWNARALGQKHCADKVSVLVADFFGKEGTLPAGYERFGDEAPASLRLTNSTAAANGETHGQDVLTTLAGRFDERNPTGANPLNHCLDVTGIELGGLSHNQYPSAIKHGAAWFGSGRFVLNTSFGFGDAHCGPPCSPSAIGSEGIPGAFFRGAYALEWVWQTSDRWGEFVLATSAGNAADEPATEIYAAFGITDVNSMQNMAARGILSLLDDASLWTPAAEGYPSLAASDSELAGLFQALQDFGYTPATNVLITGSGLAVTDRIYSQSSFSESVPDLLATGENIRTVGDPPNDFTLGTSFSTPQVAGLVSYLWLLSPDLRNEPVETTLQAILDNLRDVSGPVDLLDAYAAILSLDETTSPTPSTMPVRLALLDVDDNHKFDELDLATFRTAYFEADGTPVIPAGIDHGRYDLNGDGSTGGSSLVGRFDLDRRKSTQYGAASYEKILVGRFGFPARFDESSVTDAEIVCYYALTDLYEGEYDPVIDFCFDAGAFKGRLFARAAVGAVGCGGLCQRDEHESFETFATAFESNGKATGTATAVFNSLETQSSLRVTNADDPDLALASAEALWDDTIWIEPADSALAGQSAKFRAEVKIEAALELDSQGTWRLVGDVFASSSNPRLLWCNGRTGGAGCDFTTAEGNWNDTVTVEGFTQLGQPTQLFMEGGARVYRRPFGSGQVSGSAQAMLRIESVRITQVLVGGAPIGTFTVESLSGAAY